MVDGNNEYGFPFRFLIFYGGELVDPNNDTEFNLLFLLLNLIIIGFTVLVLTKLYNKIFAKVLTLIALVLTFTGCATNPKQPKKLENIPTTAFWVGGVDGGQWYLAEKIDSINGSVYFKIFNDHNGNLISDKTFFLKCDNNRIKWKKLQEEINAFDGTKIILKTIDKNEKYCYFE